MRKMRAVLATLALITSGAAARGSEIYRNYTDKRDRCFEHRRRLKKKQKADAYEKKVDEGTRCRRAVPRSRCLRAHRRSGAKRIDCAFRRNAAAACSACRRRTATATLAC